ncbi:hypothetical protein pb186bvf_004041 [Paramecium bursaria]
MENHETAQAQIQRWVQSSENIFNHSIIELPNQTQQSYFENFYILQDVMKESIQAIPVMKIVQQRFSSTSQFIKGAIYTMFYQIDTQNMVPLLIKKKLYEVIQRLGLDDVKKFYYEFSLFIAQQFSKLKISNKLMIFDLMQILLNQSYEGVDLCFRNFIKAINIYQDFPQYLYKFINFDKLNQKQIDKSPTLSNLICMKFLQILNFDEYYEIDNDLTLPYVNQRILSLWENQQIQLGLIGKELFYFLQKPLVKQEGRLQAIQEQIHQFYLNTILIRSKQNYINEDISLLPHDIEQKVAYVTFSQLTTESIRAHLRLFFESVGYIVDQLSLIIRFLINTQEFQNREYDKYTRIAEVIFSIALVFEMSEEIWQKYLFFIFADFLIYNNALVQEQSLLAPIYFIRFLVYKKYIQKHLNSVFDFLLTRQEKNENSRKCISDAVQILDKYESIQKILETNEIKDNIKFRMQNEQWIKKQQPVLYQEDNERKQYLQQDNYSELLNPIEQQPLLPFNSQYQEKLQYDPMEIEEDSLNQNSQTNQQEDNITIKFPTLYGQFLMKEKLNGLFQNPDDMETLLNLFQKLKSKTFEQSTMDMFITQTANLLHTLYSDQFYDINNEYPFNIMFILLDQIDDSPNLQKLFQQLKAKEHFVETLLIYGLFAKKFKSQYYKDTLNDLIIQNNLRKLERIWPAKKFQDILLSIINNHKISNHKLILYLIRKMISISQISNQLYNLFNKDNIFQIIAFILKLDAEQKTKEQHEKYLIIQGLIDKYISKQQQQTLQTNIIDAIKTLPTQDLSFWKSLKKIIQILSQQSKLNDDFLVAIIIQALMVLESQSQGIVDFIIYIPNTSKKQIFRAIQYCQQDNKDVNLQILLKQLEKYPEQQHFYDQIKNLIQQ